MRIIKVYLLLLFFTINSFAAYPLATDDAGIVIKEGFELEIGYDNCKDEAELVNKNCGVSFKHGVTDKMDIGISIPYNIEPAADENTGEASVVAKFSLIKDVLALSFTNELGEKDYFINGILTKNIFCLKCSVNAGYLSTGDHSIRGCGSYGIAVEVPVKKIELVAEIQGQEGGFGSSLAGARYRLYDNFFTAAGFSKDFQTTANKITAGLHLEF